MPTPPSQAQSSLETGGQKAKSPEDAAKTGSAGASGQDADVQFFDCTIVKINADGDEVMSDHIGPGETLRRETTDRYAAVKPVADDKK